MKKEWIYIQVVYADTHEQAIDEVIAGNIDMTHNLNARVLEPDAAINALKTISKTQPIIDKF